MYTLIFNGSPRRAGDTSALIQAFCREIRGQVEQIDAYRSTLSPCVDCRRCAGGGGCVINDGMQEIYEKVEKAQVLVEKDKVMRLEELLPYDWRKIRPRD